MKQNNACSGRGIEKKKMVIGITGGIGAGKSTVLAYISGHFEVSVILADEVGRKLMQPGESVYQALLTEYGDEILKPDGTVDTVLLSKIAFRDEESQARINRIEHPLIREEILRKIGEADTEIVFVEAALLAEGGLLPLCGEVWVIDAPEEVRIRRLMTSRGYSRERCASILKRQKTREEFCETADVVLMNADSFQETELQIEKEMRRIIAS